MKALRLFTLALTLVLAPALVCNAYSQDEDDATEQTDTGSKKKDKKSDKKKAKKKVAKKAGTFKMEKKGFKKVFEKAKDANVPVMVLFTNPPTCPYCVKLEQEVLNTSTWKRGVNGKILCVYVDNACKDPMAEELRKKYPHGGIPTYVLVNPHTMGLLGLAGGYVSSDPIGSCLRNVEYGCAAMKKYVDEHANDTNDESDE